MAFQMAEVAIPAASLAVHRSSECQQILGEYAVVARIACLNGDVQSQKHVDYPPKKKTYKAIEAARYDRVFKAFHITKIAGLQKTHQ
jgi:hypothetical protein